MPSSAALIEADKRRQVAIRNRAIRDTRVAWSRVDIQNPLSNVNAWSRLMLAVIGEYRARSASESLGLYNALRPGDHGWGQDTPEWDKAETVHSLVVTGPVRAHKLMREGMTPKQAHDKAFTLLARPVSKAVLDSGRDLIRDAVIEDRVALGYGRMLSAGACAFCTMLAGRGAVYNRDTVLKAGSQAKHRASGETFHEGCKCTMYPVFDTNDEPPGAVLNAASVYEFASENASGTKAILAGIRKSEGVR